MFPVRASLVDKLQHLTYKPVFDLVHILVSKMVSWLLGKYKQWLNFSDAQIPFFFLFFFLLDWFYYMFFKLANSDSVFCFFVVFFPVHPIPNVYGKTQVLFSVYLMIAQTWVFCCELVFMYQVDDSVCLPTVAAALAFVATFHLVVYN